MHSICGKSIFKPLKQYLEIHRSLFCKRSFKNFVILICAMLAIQEVRSIKFIYEKFIKKNFEGCLNSFYYFLTDEALDLSKMASCTLQPKFGDHFDCYSTLFDHAKHEGSHFIKGHCFVSLAMSTPIITNHHIKYITLPTSCRLYDKSKTKLEMAAEMIEEIMPELKNYQVIVLCDAWYTKKPFLSSILVFDNVDVIGAASVFDVYRMRWPIEVMFYQQKPFWSFGKYMVRSKVAIEKYANLVGVTYMLTQLLPFLHSDFTDYQFQSPQETKYTLGEKLIHELIMGNLLKTLQLDENTKAISALRKYLDSEDIAS